MVQLIHDLNYECYTLSLDGLHVDLHEFVLAVGVFLLEEDLECPSDWFVVRLVAVDIPVLEDD